MRGHPRPEELKVIAVCQNEVHKRVSMLGNGYERELERRAMRELKIESTPGLGNGNRDE